MTTEIFTQWLNRFIKHAKPIPESPILLIMDNHVTHISLEAIKLAKENNIMVLTLPPQTSHRLQPLDKTVYFPLKKFITKAAKRGCLTIQENELVSTTSQKF